MIIFIFEGFDHEHNRPDRDEHVEIFWDNIRDDKNTRRQFTLCADCDDPTTPYDLHSIMHYSSFQGRKANAKGVAMKTKDGKGIPGHRYRLTEWDIQKVNDKYN